jgi:hypothetical protein
LGWGQWEQQKLYESQASSVVDAAQHYIFKILSMKTALKIKKITMFQISIDHNINPIKPSAGLPNLIRPSL